MKSIPIFRLKKCRQQSGYDKMPLILFSWPIRFDVYLLRFPTGSKIPAHIDPNKAGKHFRMNIVLKQAKLGGKFFCEQPIFETQRIKFFRPDLHFHSVSEIISGTRYVLSIGWIKK